MNNILIIGAHFDDVELGAGGTAAKLASQGKNVFKLTLTDNVTRFEQMGIHVAFESSKMQSAKACQTLGIHEIADFEPLPCNHLTYTTETMQSIERIIFEREIDTVFMHYPHDMNQDHVEASRLCLTAARHCKNLLMFQSNIYVGYDELHPVFFVDISDYLEVKKEALAQYGSEHNRFDQLFEVSIHRNRIWGYENKVEYAEGFYLVKYME